MGQGRPPVAASSSSGAGAVGWSPPPQVKSQYFFTSEDDGDSHYESLMRLFDYAARWAQANLAELAGAGSAMRQAQSRECVCAKKADGISLGLSPGQRGREEQERP